MNRLDSEKRTRRFGRIGAGLALAGMVAGCAQPGDPVTTGPAAKDPNIQVRYSPASLRGDLRVESAASRKFEGLMQANVSLRNVTNAERVLRYQATWKDGDGFQVGDPGPWQKLLLGSGQVENIKLAAPSPSGRKVVLQVRADR